MSFESNKWVSDNLTAVQNVQQTLDDSGDLVTYLAGLNLTSDNLDTLRNALATAEQEMCRLGVLVASN